MTLLPSNAALAAEWCALQPFSPCAAVILFRQLLQLALAKPHLFTVACIQKQKLHCHDAAVFECSTGTTQQSNTLCQHFPSVLSWLCPDTCCSQVLPVDFCCLPFLGILKNMGLSDGFLLQEATNHHAATAEHVVTPSGVATFSLACCHDSVQTPSLLTIVACCLT